jgi:hypothetical protein
MMAVRREKDHRRAISWHHDHHAGSRCPEEACYWAGRSIGGVSDGCSSKIEFHLAAAAQEGCQEGVEAQESFSDEKKNREGCQEG